MHHIPHLLHSVGQFQLVEQQKVKNTDVSEKTLNQLVSYVDIESEKMLVTGLKEITPNASFLTEEDTEVYNNESEYWIIDPLDGTTNYLFGHKLFSISIAYVNKNKTRFGAVYIPADNQLFLADETGAYLNNKKINVSNRVALESALIATGFPYYNFNEMDEYLSILNTLMKSTKGLRRMGSAAIDLAYTACGLFDGFFELNLSPWDVAAGAYIVKQAGGVVSDFKNDNNYIFGNSILAGNPSIHPKILEIIKDSGL